MAPPAELEELQAILLLWPATTELETGAVISILLLCPLTTKFSLTSLILVNVLWLLMIIELSS